MSETLAAVRNHVTAGRMRVSQHGLVELLADKIELGAVLAGLATAIVVEEYSDYVKGPCILCLQQDASGEPLHIVWGIAAGNSNVATIIGPIQRVG